MNYCTKSPRYDIQYLELLRNKNESYSMPPILLFLARKKRFVAYFACRYPEPLSKDLKTRYAYGISLSLCLSSFFLTHFSNFYETWYEYHASIGHSSFVFSQFRTSSNTNMTLKLY
jgi:hypothetical protein